MLYQQNLLQGVQRDIFQLGKSSFRQMFFTLFSMRAGGSGEVDIKKFSTVDRASLLLGFLRE